LLRLLLAMAAALLSSPLLCDVQLSLSLLTGDAERSSPLPPPAPCCCCFASHSSASVNCTGEGVGDSALAAAAGGGRCACACPPEELCAACLTSSSEAERRGGTGSSASQWRGYSRCVNCSTGAGTGGGCAEG